MIDSFVLLTPIIMLGVVSLLGFVGCHLVFGLDRVEPRTPLLAATPGNDEVDLQWGVDGNALEFRVKRGTVSGAYDPLDVVTSGKYTYRDTDVTNGTTYYYVVSAIGGDGETPNSNEVAATPNVALSNEFLSENTRGTPATAAGLFGMAVTVGSQPLKVTDLGRIFLTGNSGDHILKVIDASNDQQVGAAIVVSMTGGTNGQFKYGPIPDPNPIILQPAGRYYVLTQETNPGDQFLNHNTTITVNDPTAAVVDGAARSNAATFIIDAPGEFSYGLVNFKYQVQ